MAVPATKIERAAHLHRQLRVGPLLRRLPTWNGVLCLCFHRVGEPDNPIWERELRGISADELDWRLRMVRRHAEVISPADMLALDQAPRGRHVLVTFDDGYRGWVDAVLPILEQHRIQAAFFVATGFIDRPHTPWWYEIPWTVRNAGSETLPTSPWTSAPVQLGGSRQDDAIAELLDVYKSVSGPATADFLAWLRRESGSGGCDQAVAADCWLSWDEVRTLRDAGMEVGGHTMNHPVLSRLSEAEQETEIAGCAERLEAELGRPMRTFSYPVGLADSFGTTTEEILARLRVDLAFSYHGGFLRHGRPLDRLSVPRVTGDMDREIFEALLTSPQLFGRW